MIEPELNPQNRVRENALTCPYIGVPHDPETHFAFPHVANFCHRVKPPEPVRLDYQRTHCMSAKYWDCPLMQENWQGRLPAKIRGEDTRPLNKRVERPRLWLVATAVFVVIFLAVFLWFGQPGIRQSITQLFNLGSGTNQAAGGATGTLPVTPALEITSTTSMLASQATGILPATATPIPTVELTPTPGPVLETPFGPQGEFLLHTVIAGESLQSVAQTYSTSVEVLTAANETLQAQQTSVAVLGSANVQVSTINLWPGTILVVLPGKTDPTGVPQLRWLMLEEDTQVDNLAKWLSVTAEDLRYYNHLGQSEWIPAGRYLIAPVANESLP